jgi:hypothetical protein
LPTRNGDVEPQRHRGAQVDHEKGGAARH